MFQVFCDTLESLISSVRFMRQGWDKDADPARLSYPRNEIYMLLHLMDLPRWIFSCMLASVTASP